MPDRRSNVNALVESLLGADVGTVCSRCGPPLALAIVGDELRLAYAGGDGKRIDDAVVVVDGVVVRIAPALRALHAKSSPDTMVGRRLEEVMAGHGTPLRLAKTTIGFELTFPTCVVTVHDGYVVGAITSA
jgi:hypothetical protein